MPKKRLLTSIVALAMVIAGAFLLLGNTAAQGGCDVSAWKGDDLITDFLDTVDLAGATGRGALAPVIIELQSRHRRLERIEHPACLQQPVSDTLEAMQHYVTAFLDFMLDSDSLANMGIRTAEAKLLLAAAQFEEAGATVDARMRDLDN